jgi:hypothetical protein
MSTVLGARYVRIAFAILLLAIAAWSISPYLAYRISSGAFINSEVVRVKAPIPGRLADSLPYTGEFIGQASSLTLITSPSSDRRQLLDLQSQKIAATERASFDQSQLVQVTKADAELEKRLADYQANVVTRIGFEIAEAEAEKAGCHAEEAQRSEIGTRLQGLVNSGASSEFKLAQALAELQLTATKCAMVDPKLDRLKAELASIQKGIYIRDGSSDVPYSQQQRDRLFLRGQELEADIQQQTSRATELASAVKEEQRRLDYFGQYDLKLPADHVVWSVPASPGSAVIEGQTVLDLADCEHRFVAVELPEREFEHIKPGEEAAVRLVGSDEWLSGHIRQVRGSAALDDGRLLAAQVPVPTPGNITVEVTLPPDKEASRSTSYCGIGRLAEVRFNRERPAFVDRVSDFIKSVFNRSTPAEKVARQ